LVIVLINNSDFYIYIYISSENSRKHYPSAIARSAVPILKMTSSHFSATLKPFINLKLSQPKYPQAKSKFSYMSLKHSLDERDEQDSSRDLQNLKRTLKRTRLRRQWWESRVQKHVLKTKVGVLQSHRQHALRSLIGATGETMNRCFNTLVHETFKAERGLELAQFEQINVERKLCPLTMISMGIQSEAFCLSRVLGLSNEQTRRSWLLVSKKTNRIAKYMGKRWR